MTSSGLILILYAVINPFIVYYILQYYCYYDVTSLSTMTSLTPLLWRHLPLYYDVTNLSFWSQ